MASRRYVPMYLRVGVAVFLPAMGRAPHRLIREVNVSTNFFYPICFRPPLHGTTLELVAENRPICCAHGPRDFADVGRVQYLTVLLYLNYSTPARDSIRSSPYSTEDPCVGF